MKSIYLKNIFLVYIVIFSFSCKDNESSINKQKTFDAHETNEEFQKLNNNKKTIDFIINTTSCNYTNNDEYDHWATRFFIKNKHVINTSNIEKLKNLGYLISEKYYLNFGLKFGNFILENPDLITKKELIPIAASNITKYYVFQRNKDSIEKYLKIIENNISYDSSKTILLDYNIAKSNLANLNGHFFEEALYIHKAIEHTDQNDKIIKSTFYLNLASMYVNLNYIEKSNACIDSALKLISIEQIDKSLLNTIGIIQSKNKQFDQAENTFKFIINEGNKTNNIGLLAQAYSNFANSKRREKKIKEAFVFMDRSDSFCKILNLEYGLLINKINRAELYLELNEPKIALTEIKSSEKLLKEKYNNPKLNMEYYSILYKIYDQLNDKNNANLNYRNYYELKQKFQGDIPRSIISEWELANEREKYLNNITENQRIQKNYLKITLISVIILFVASTIYFLKNRNHIIEKNDNELEKQKIKHELELKSKELLTESINNFTIQNTKNWIFEELDELVRDLPQSHQKKFINLKRKLKANSNDQFINEFETRFKGVYETFYQKILAIAPDLTPNELRICAFMRLHISTKEIAYLTNRTIGTIDNTRSIIRKKLKLDENESLQQFLINL